MSAQRYDVIVAGGGHNGLVAATYLGRAGLREICREYAMLILCEAFTGN